MFLVHAWDKEAEIHRMRLEDTTTELDLTVMDYDWLDGTENVGRTCKGSSPSYVPLYRFSHTYISCTY